mgnify:CR=1 FL=1
MGQSIFLREGEEYIKLYKNGAPALLLHAAPADNEFSKFHIGSMYQNAALYCAAAGLNNKMKEKETDKLAGKLILPEGWKIFIVQTLGHPAKP